MSGSPLPGSTPPPPPDRVPGPPGGPGQVTPSRHKSDGVLRVFEFLLAVFLVYALIITPLYFVFAPTSDSTGVDETGIGEAAAATGFALVFSQFIFQALQGVYPWLVEFRRGHKLSERLRLQFKLPFDMGAGVALAILCSVGAYIATTVSADIVGLDNSDDASNTGIITDNEGSVWVYAIIAMVVVGAPLAEELLFRGLLLRSIERWAGTTAGVIGSSILFMIPHVQIDATWQETTVLWSALLVVGLILAIGAVKIGRIGPAIIAHLLFNAVGVIGALAATT